MDLHQLRTFVAVAQEQHLTRAAERLHISQPTASAHIKALEESLEVTLFVRRSHGLELTPAGELLRKKAEDVLDRALELRASARSLVHAVTGRAVIGCNADPVTSRIGTLVRALAANAPLVEVAVELRSTVAILGGLRNGELDVGFFLGPQADASLDVLRLTTLSFVVAGPAAWRDRIRAADMAALARMPWIVTPPGNSHSAMVGRLFRDVGFAPERTVEANNDLVMRTMIAEGVGLSLVRSDHAELGEREGTLAVAPQAKTQAELLFAYRSARSGEPVIRALRAEVEATWADAIRS